MASGWYPVGREPADRLGTLVCAGTVSGTPRALCYCTVCGALWRAEAPVAGAGAAVPEVTAWTADAVERHGANCPGVGALALSGDAWGADSRRPGDLAWWHAVRATGERRAPGRVLMVARVEDSTTVVRDVTAIADTLALGRPVRPPVEHLAAGNPWAILLPAADEDWDPRWYLGLNGRLYEAELGRVGTGRPIGPLCAKQDAYRLALALSVALVLHPDNTADRGV